VAWIPALLAIVLLAVARPRARPRDASALPKPSDEVKRLISGKQELAAIRAYRRQTGASLLEAYQVVRRNAA
jgi:hypothetical protein